jgi:hypothetical protein
MLGGVLKKQMISNEHYSDDVRAIVSSKGVGGHTNMGFWDRLNQSPV